MRLTNAIREEMVGAIMRDTPDGRKKVEEQFRELVTQFYLDRLPSDAARELYKDHPEIFERRGVCIYGYRWQPDNDIVEIPSHEYDDPFKKEPWYEPLASCYESAVKAREAAQAEVELALKSVTTAKRLKEVYPDLAKYLPSDISGQALAVPQGLPNLHKAGWPKEKANETRE